MVEAAVVEAGVVAEPKAVIAGVVCPGVVEAGVVAVDAGVVTELL